MFGNCNFVMECRIIILMCSCFIGPPPSSAAIEGTPAFSISAIYAVTSPTNTVQVSQERNAEPTIKKQALSDQLQENGESQTQANPFNQIHRQQGTTANMEEEIARQEQAARDLDKAVVGLEIAQGAIEITLGAIRIAASATTAEVIRREDAIAASKASASSVAFGSEGNQVNPVEIEPIARDTVVKRAACARHDPYSKWNDGYRQRIRRSSFFSPLVSNLHSFEKPTPNPSSNAHPVKLPDTEEAEHLLNLLENLLDTNNRVLTLLGIDLPPLTNQPNSPGTVLLREYKQKLSHRRHYEQRYGDTGYVAQDMASEMLHEDNKWKSTFINRRPDVHTFSSELAQLNRMRRRLMM